MYIEYVRCTNSENISILLKLYHSKGAKGRCQSQDIPPHLFAFPFLPAETPKCKAKSTVRVKADGDLPRRIQLTLELDGSTQSIDCGMGHLQGKERGTGWNWHQALMIVLGSFDFPRLLKMIYIFHCFKKTDLSLT